MMPMLIPLVVRFQHIVYIKTSGFSRKKVLTMSWNSTASSWISPAAQSGHCPVLLRPPILREGRDRVPVGDQGKSLSESLARLITN